MVNVSNIHCVWMIALTLLVATWMDHRTKTVYRFVWWPVLAICIVGFLKTLFCSPQIFLSATIREVLVFGFLQEFFFCRFYGRADCHGFAVGAVSLFLQGGGMWQFLLQMVFAFLLLFVTQLFAHNMNHDGNLKRPVAFLPYITVGWGLVQLAYFV